MQLNFPLKALICCAVSCVLILHISSCKKYNDGYAKVKCVSGKIGGKDVSDIKMGASIFEYDTQPTQVQLVVGFLVCKETGLTISASKMPLQLGKRIAWMRSDTANSIINTYEKAVCGMRMEVQGDQIAARYAPLSDDTTQNFVRIWEISKNRRHFKFEVHGTFYKYHEPNPPFDLSCNPNATGNSDTIHIDHLIVEAVDR
ncbi:MAG: hypothetical protein RL660_2629 [Bacteroidota bacterium]|jgi:hypothetical protein